MADAKLLSKVLGLKSDSFDKEASSTPGFKDLSEIGKPGKGKFSAPARYQITIDSSKGGGVEKYYYWFVRFMQARPPFGININAERKTGYVMKTKDVFNATETSSYWGNIEQRKGVQQDKVGQYLAAIGKMLKDMFQIIREVRIIDERLVYYHGIDKNDKAADFALKGIWIDMVEGGARNPSSVYGLANQVGFITLPDLFFATFVKKSAEVNDVMDKNGQLKAFNRKVREVLARKLKQYLVWKESTQKELETRRNFTLKYLRQHYNIIRLYMNWLRPYLRNIQRLQMEGRQLSDVDLVSSFETSKIELEAIGVFTQYRKEVHSKYEEFADFKKYFPVIRVRVNYVTIPNMVFQSEYQRGPMHTGHTTIIIDAFVVEKDELEEYKKKVQNEDLELLSSLFEVMNSMKDDLKNYLNEAGEKFPEDEPKETKKKEPSAFEPIKSAWDGFKEMFSVFTPGGSTSSGEEKVDENEFGYAMGMTGRAYTLYYVFKKSQRFVTE